jgi:GFO/IDH/MocA oxidoreductase family protein
MVENTQFPQQEGPAGAEPRPPSRNARHGALKSGDLSNLARSEATGGTMLARVRGPAVGLVGHGSWGRYILRDLVSLGCSTTVVTRDEARRRAALEAGAVAVVGGLEDLPPHLSGVVVASPTRTDADVVEALLSRELPLFVEKPLTNDAGATGRHSPPMPAPPASGRYGLDREGERREVIMAPRSGAGLRDGDGRYWARTSDPQLVELVLSQLS